MPEPAQLPFPDVRLGPDYLARLELLTLRISAARERREGAGRAFLQGAGEEFVGHRPYRPGEDLRKLDWALLARLDRPYVRVTRREAAEHWCVMIDTSGSMGVGPPGKLQRAAEAAGAIAAIGLHCGARVELLAQGAQDGPVVRFLARRRTDLRGLVQFLGSLRAGGSADVGSLMARRGPVRDVGRLFLIGDLLDLQPSALSRLLAPGRDLFCLRLLAPVELAPLPDRSVEWRDPEGQGRLLRHLDRTTLLAYEARLEERLEAWERFSQRHGVAHCLVSSELPFEEAVRRLLGT